MILAQGRTQKFFEGGSGFFFSYIFDFWEGSKKFSHTNFNLEGGTPPGYAHVLAALMKGGVQGGHEPPFEIKYIFVYEDN